MDDEVRLLVAFALALVGARISVPVAIRLAWRTSFFDRPAGYKAHGQPTPYLGGAAVMAAFVVPALAFGGGGSDFLVIVVGAAALTVLGTLDDRIGIAPLPRVLAEIVLAAAVWKAGLGWDVFQGDPANLMLTVFWVVGLVNAFNLMDNMDGAAGSVATVSGGGVALLAILEGHTLLAAFTLALVGACSGFLPFNLARPSRIFLGDGGSMPIGFVAASGVMVIGSDQTVGVAAVAAVAPLVGLPILDTTLVVVSRLRRRADLLAGGQDHLTHRLRSWASSARSVAGILAIGQAASCGLAVAMLGSGEELIVGGTLSYLLVGAVAIGALEAGHARLGAHERPQPVKRAEAPEADKGSASYA